jgi:hypothetical protein
VAPSGRGRALLYAGATAALLASTLWLHARQGLARPIPWPDEASLLWQAIAVQRGTTLFAPQLRDYAHVLWMPPGYMWVTGLVFKVVGFSLETARWLSALFLAGGGAALAAVLWRSRHPFAGLLLLAVFLWSPVAVLVGNVARMEALVFALACSVLLLLQRGRLWGGLALAALVPLVHPVGLFVAAGAGAYVVARLWREPGLRRPRRGEALALALALAAWLAYAAYVAQHWAVFLGDMRLNVGYKAERAGGAGAVLRRLVNPALALPTLALAAAALWSALGRRLASGLLLVLAAPLVAMSVLLHGWPYDFYPALLALLAGLLLVELTSELAQRAEVGARPRAALVLALALGLAAAGHQAFRRARLFQFSVEQGQVPRDSTAGVPFLTPEDRAVLAERLRQLSGPPERPVTILFIPMAEALLFAELDGDTRRLVFPLLRREPADVVILHESRHFPAVTRRNHELWAASWQAVPVPVERWPSVRERDGTERWRIFDRAPGPRARP